MIDSAGSRVTLSTVRCPDRAPLWLLARLHGDVIHKCGLSPLLRTVDAPDSAQFFRDL